MLFHARRFGFRKAVVDVGLDAAIQLMATHGQNPCAWLANPPLASQQIYAECEPLMGPHKHRELEEDEQLNKELGFLHSSMLSSYSLNGEGIKNEAPTPLPSTEIYASLFRSFLGVPSVTEKHNK